MRHVLVIVALCFWSTAHAASDSKWTFSVGGEADLEGLRQMQSVGADNRTFRGIGTGRLPISLKHSNKVSGVSNRFRALPLVQWDPQNISKSERFYFDPQELYYQFQLLPWTLQLGLNVVQWGDTDIFNPLDVVNQRRYFDPLRSEKIGAPMLLLKHDFESFFVEGLFVPNTHVLGYRTRRRTMLPGDKSRWLPREIYQSKAIATVYGTGNLILPSNLNYSYYEPVEEGHPFDNNFGARIKFRLSGFDWTFVGFEGAAITPAVNIRSISLRNINIANFSANVDPDVGLRAAYYKVRMAGTSFVWVMGDYLVKGAAAFTDPLSSRTDLAIPERSYENVLGLERTFSFGEHSLTAIGQGTYVDAGSRENNNSVSISRMFDRGAMAALRWTPNESGVFLLSYLRDLRFGGGLMHAEGSWKIRDGWKVKGTTDVLAGPTETPIGTYRKNSRASIALNSQW